MYKKNVDKVNSGLPSSVISNNRIDLIKNFFWKKKTYMYMLSKKTFYV